MKIPRFDLHRIDMKVRHEHVARGNDGVRLVAWIRPATMGELIAPARRQLELFVAVSKADQVA